MINAAVIGLGWWGSTLVRTLQGSDSIRISTGVDPNEAGMLAGRDLGLRMAGSFEEVVADPSIDAVLLCTPHKFHAAQVVAAAKSGKHVFCEKPFTDNVRAAEEALDAVSRAGVVLGIGHERRFEPAVMQMRDLVSSGKLGDAVSFEGNFSQDKFLALPRDNWRLSAEHAPVGPLSATGIHLVDMAISLLGHPEQVWANLSNDFAGFDNGDSLSISLKFSKGRTATINAILVTPFVGRAAVYGTEGWFEIRDRTHPEASTGWDLALSLRGQDTQVDFSPPYSAVRANVEAFARAATGDAEYPVTHAEIRSNVATFEAILASVRSGAIERVG